MPTGYLRSAPIETLCYLGLIPESSTWRYAILQLESTDVNVKRDLSIHLYFKVRWLISSRPFLVIV